MKSKIELVSFDKRKEYDNVITISPMELNLISELVPPRSHLMCCLIDSQFRDANFYGVPIKNCEIDYKMWIAYNWDVLNRFNSNFLSIKNQFAYTIDDETFKFIINNCSSLYLFLRESEYDSKYINEHFKEIEESILNLEKYIKDQI